MKNDESRGLCRLGGGVLIILHVIWGGVLVILYDIWGDYTRHLACHMGGYIFDFNTFFVERDGAEFCLPREPVSPWHPPSIYLPPESFRGRFTQKAFGAGVCGIKIKWGGRWGGGYGTGHFSFFRSL